MFGQRTPALGKHEKWLLTCCNFVACLGPYLYLNQMQKIMTDISIYDVYSHHKVI